MSREKIIALGWPINCTAVLHWDSGSMASKKRKILGVLRIPFGLFAQGYQRSKLAKRGRVVRASFRQNMSAAEVHDTITRGLCF